MKGALSVKILCYFKKAKGSKLKHCTKRPDIDNLEKAVLDGLNGVAFVDDSQIIKSSTEKLFADDGVEKVVISITEIER